MPSHIGQQLIVIRGKTKNGKTPYILMMKPNGYLDIWFYDHHYHLQNVVTLQNVKNLNQINVKKIVDDYEADQEKKKGKIVIKRK